MEFSVYLVLLTGYLIDICLNQTVLVERFDYNKECPTMNQQRDHF